MPLRDPLHRLFSPDVLARLEAVRRPPPSPWDRGGNPFRQRHLIVQAKGPEPSRWRWARRRAWGSYLRVAESCGLLDCPDVVSRLVGDDDDGFRSAIAECCTAWYFTRRRRAKVSPNPASKKQKNFDLVVAGSMTVNVEVKAPYVPRVNGFGAGDDARTLRKCVEDAGEQFKKGHPNLVVLVPALRIHVCEERDQLLKATIGEHALKVFVRSTGSKPRKPEAFFHQNGKLAKRWLGHDGVYRTDLTRVSAVMTIEHQLVEGSLGPRLVPVVVVVHNPFALTPVPADFFGRVPQWVIANGEMGWTDSYDGP